MKKGILFFLVLISSGAAFAQQQAGDTVYGFFAAIIKQSGLDETGFLQGDYGKFITDTSQWNIRVSGPITGDFPDFVSVRGGYEIATAEKVSKFFGGGVGYTKYPDTLDVNEFTVDLTLGVRFFTERSYATEFRYQYTASTDELGDGLHMLLAGIKVLKRKQ